MAFHRDSLRPALVARRTSSISEISDAGHDSAQRCRSLPGIAPGILGKLEFYGSATNICLGPPGQIVKRGATVALSPATGEQCAMPRGSPCALIRRYQDCQDAFMWLRDLLRGRTRVRIPLAPPPSLGSEAFSGPSVAVVTTDSCGGANPLGLAQAICASRDNAHAADFLGDSDFRPQSTLGSGRISRARQRPDPGRAVHL